jgi:adenine-specific DNA-methyltransferase
VSVRYIGSKTRIVDQIMAVLGPPDPGSGRFVDAFCGTGAVAAGAAALGWRVHLNDQLYAAVCLASARVASTEEAGFAGLGGYDAAVAQLNECPPVEGFVWREYTPVSLQFAGVERRYFTIANGARIDGVRHRIREWHQACALSEVESRLLIADLLQAANRIANISGTYGCFLREWSSQAHEPLRVRARVLAPVAREVTATIGSASVLDTTASDVYYIDPPYTKRQYAAYYHLLETIAHGDAPRVVGVTGLRPWRDRASEFCYKRRALGAFEELISRINASRILISYSSEGHIELAPLKAMLAMFGRVGVHDVGSIGRYRPNEKASEAGMRVTEYIIELLRAPVPAPCEGAGV